jgi:hypothetical protein
MEYMKVNLPMPVVDRLKLLKHKGQTLAGVIEEILDKQKPPENCVEPLPTHVSTPSD